MASESGVKQQALGISGTAQTQAGSAYDQLNQQYTQEANDPTGLTPQQKANMTTASMQAIGGGQAAAVGQGALLGARTNNAGAAAAAIDDSARQAGVQDSANALGVQNEDAKLQIAQRQQGLEGLDNLYNTASGTQVSALNTANNAQRPFWQQLALQGTAAAGQAASGGAFK